MPAFMNQNSRMLPLAFISLRHGRVAGYVDHNSGHYTEKNVEMAHIHRVFVEAEMEHRGANAENHSCLKQPAFKTTSNDISLPDEIST